MEGFDRWDQRRGMPPGRGQPQLHLQGAGRRHHPSHRTPPSAHLAAAPPPGIAFQFHKPLGARSAESGCFFLGRSSKKHGMNAGALETNAAADAFAATRWTLVLAAWQRCKLRRRPPPHASKQGKTLSRQESWREARVPMIICPGLRIREDKTGVGPRSPLAATIPLSLFF